VVVVTTRASSPGYAVTHGVALHGGVGADRPYVCWNVLLLGG